MSFSEIRPLLSAMIGIAIAGWLKVKWARRVPARVGTKGREQLLKEHRRSIWVANLLAFVGLFSGLLSFKSGWLNASDCKNAMNGCVRKTLVSRTHRVAGCGWMLASPPVRT